MSQVTNPIILNSTGQDIALALAGLATAIANKPDPATQTPVMDGAGGVGSSLKYAREDHQHPSDDAKANQAQLAYVETGSTASRAYSVGEYFCWNGLLYRVTATISSGGAFTPGTNCVAVTVSDSIQHKTVQWTPVNAVAIAADRCTYTISGHLLVVNVAVTLSSELATWAAIYVMQNVSQTVGRNVVSNPLVRVCGEAYEYHVNRIPIDILYANGAIQIRNDTGSPISTSKQIYGQIVLGLE